MSLFICLSFSSWAVLAPSVSLLDIVMVQLQGNNCYEFLEITAFLQDCQQHIHWWVNSVINACSHWPSSLWNLCLCLVATFLRPPPMKWEGSEWQPW
jgi:hypothetical protein